MPEAHRIFPHGKLEELAPGLWQVEGSLPFPLKRNMTVHRMADGGLLVYSAVALDDAGMQSLEALGTPSVMVVPHPMHTMDAPFYKARYPGLRVIAAKDSAAKLAGKLEPDADAGGLAELGVTARVVPGMKYTEIVLQLDAGGAKALVFTDLVGTASPGLMMKLLGPPGGGFGVARIVRLRQIADRKAVRGFLSEQAGIEGLSLVLGAHGKPLLGGCAEAMKSAAQRC